MVVSLDYSFYGLSEQVNKFAHYGCYELKFQKKKIQSTLKSHLLIFTDLKL
jgi:hypothetical protein